MHPVVFILPSVIARGGLLAFVSLPLDFTLRALVLGSDWVSAVVIGSALWRRSSR